MPQPLDGLRHHAPPHRAPLLYGPGRVCDLPPLLPDSLKDPRIPPPLFPLLFFLGRAARLRPAGVQSGLNPHSVSLRCCWRVCPIFTDTMGHHGPHILQATSKLLHLLQKIMINAAGTAPGACATALAWPSGMKAATNRIFGRTEWTKEVRMASQIAGWCPPLLVPLVKRS